MTEKNNNTSTAGSDKLVSNNMGFVVSVARSFAGRGLSLDDLIAEGTLGMLEAARRFDAGRGTPFTAYAAPFVRAAMRHAVDEENALYRIPRKEATAAEKKKSKARSLDAPLSAGNQFSLLDVLADKNAEMPDDQDLQNRVRGEINSCLDVLSDRERNVVTAFYGLNGTRLPLSEIANNLGIKRERARQIRTAAVRKIARRTKNAALRSFLRR